MYKKAVIKNGIRVVSHDMPDRQSAALGIWIDVGSRYETKKISGIAHFLEHLIFKGSRKYSCRQIKESIEGIGGALNGFTSEEFTAYIAKFPANCFDRILNVLSDMVLNPLFPPEEIEKERTVIIEEIKMYKDLPQSYVSQLLDGMLWPKHPLGENIAGTIESVKGLSRKDLRAFKEKHYSAPHILIAACGRLDQDEILGKIEKRFGNTAVVKRGHYIGVKEDQSHPAIKVFNKDTEQTHLALGFHSLHRGHPDKHALGLLHIILGGNMSSRLFNEVREKKGLAYEIGTGIARLHDSGAFIVHAGIDNHKVKPALEVILRELERVKEKLVTEDEFRRAREFYTGQLTLALEDTMDHMLWVGESMIALDKTYTLEDIINQVNEVTRQDIQRLARQIFNKNKVNLALIGPLKEQERELHKCVSSY
ncbi:MAG: pitrilysin family protein [Candidatus Omnitrophica bacterium]|nr:pitrilysin family protein [Candidatus Omnitrophota bacterium]MDD5655118.1 pitrilysin family protein [Candidatus Omnitrophota bacterium]